MIFKIVQGNLKVHAMEKLKAIQKIISKQTRRKIRRAVKDMSDVKDSIETEEEEDEKQ